ncbi:MAG: glycosyltransferase family 4 protein [Bacteroidetes bacterium]|jgi:glycosyltransferase involved in cell wall biosynthesis|nr:glycosyltransferase family 4 protein [Bacteroidota bacterium]
MKVWFIAIADFPEGRGITPRLRNLMSGLAERGVDVALKIPYAYGYVGVGQNTSATGEANGVPFEFISRTVARPATEAGVVAAKLKANLLLALPLLFGPVPHAVVLYNTSFIDTGLVILSAKLRGVRVIFDVCDERFDEHALGWRRSWFRRINAWQTRVSDRTLFRWADGFLCVSTYLREKIVQRGGHAPMLMVPLASILRPGEARTIVDRRPDSLAYLGSLIADEGIEVLFEAVAALARERPGLTLTVIGDANAPEYRQRLRALVEALRLGERVRFLGPRPATEALDELRRHEVLVLPRPDSVISRAGFPGKISEYCASQRPIASTRFGDMTRYFEDGRDIYFADGYGAVEVAAVIRRALNDRHRSDAVGHEGFRTCLERFGYDAVSAQVHGFIDDVVHGRAAGTLSGTMP